MRMDKRYEIREFKAQDRDALNACIRELQEHERQFEPRMKSYEMIADSYLDNLLARCAETSGRILVAETQGEVVGYVCVNAEEPNTDEDEVAYDYALVADIVVTRAHRGQGIGKALLEAAEHYAKNRGARWLRIWVLAQNAGAQALYQRSGFTPRLTELEKTLDGGR